MALDPAPRVFDVVAEVRLPAVSWPNVRAGVAASLPSTSACWSPQPASAPPGPFLESDLAEQLAMLEVNCRAVLTLTHLIASRMTASRASGGIILFGSLVARQGAPGSAHYGATKAWVQALGEVLHVELARHGIDVLTATPGPVHTGFASRAGMELAIAAHPSTVAAGALREKHMTTSPGALSKILGGSLAGLPRSVRTRIMGQVIRGLTVTPSRHPSPSRTAQGKRSSTRADP